MAKLQKRDIPRIIKLHESGVSCREIGLLFGISSQAISRRLKKLGIETNCGGYCEKRSQIKEKHEKIIAMYGQGLSKNAIARQLKMSASGVSYAIAKYSPQQQNPVT
jgi:transposase